MAEGDAPESKWVEPTSEVASNIVTAVAGWVAGPEGSAIAVGASPMIKQAVSSVSTRWYELTHRGGERVLEEATAAGVPLDQLEALVGEDVGRLMLAGAAIDAGTRTAYPDKLRALGRALAAGVSDVALVDPERLAVAALDDMEAPHVKVLRHIAEEEPPKSPSRARLSWSVGWSGEALARDLPEVAPVLAPILATLQRHALIELDTRLGDAMSQFERRRQHEYRRSGGRGDAARWETMPGEWHVTDFGLDVLHLLRESSESEDHL